MMRYLSLLACLVLSCLFTLAGAQPKLLWSSYRDLESLTGGTGTESAIKLLPRVGGGFYAVGWKYVARFDDSGNLLWKTHHPGTNLNACATPSGVAIVGGFSWTSGLVSIYQIDDNGNQAWSKNVPVSFGYQATHLPIAADNAGSVYAVTNLQLIKFSPSGSQVWSRKDASWGSMLGLAVSGPNLVVTGRASGAGTTGYAASLDSNGNARWTHPFTATASCITPGTNGSVFVASGSTSVTKLDTNGAQVWQATLGIAGSQLALATNAAGYVGESNSSSMSLINPNGTLAWSYDTYARYPTEFGLALDSQNAVLMSGLFPIYDTPGPFVMKVNAAGTLVYDHNFQSGNLEDDYVESIFVGANDRVIGLAAFQMMGPTYPFSSYPYNNIFQLDTAGNVVWNSPQDLGGSSITTWDARTATSGATYVIAGQAGQVYYGTTSSYRPPRANGPIVLTKFMPSGRADWSVKFNITTLNALPMIELAPNNGVVVAGGELAYDPVNDDFPDAGRIMRYDSSGKLSWSKTYAQHVDVNAIATSSSAIFAAIFDGNALTATKTTIYKFDTNGKQVWATIMPVAAVIFDATVDSSGNLYVCGQDGSSEEILVTKFSSAGVPQWTYLRNESDQAYDFGIQLAVDSFGVYVRGKAYDDFGGTSDRVVKLDASGNFLWETVPTASDYQESITRMVPDRTGGVYASGLVNANLASRQMYIRRFDANGNVLWTYLCPGALALINQKMITDSSGAVYATADIASPSAGVDFGIYKLTPTGTAPWPTTGANYRNRALFFDSNSFDDNTLALSRDPLNNLYVGGFSCGSNGTADINLVKFGAEHSQYVAQSFPTAMKMGHVYSVTITVKNTGTTTWTSASGYSLVPVYATWGVSSVPLVAADSITPGKSKTFTFNVTAPSKAGSYSSRWTMQRTSTMFGAESNLVTVGVTP